MEAFRSASGALYKAHASFRKALELGGREAEGLCPLCGSRVIGFSKSQFPATWIAVTGGSSGISGTGSALTLRARWSTIITPRGSTS
ncbi:MAG: hypothetical protein F7C07_07575 [Desulfurococcales archaeon]|nr:hypothetical protein [Desulfurococcales archaeon]